jgi:2,3-bisphosphoglycerate-independent phosphoglycerate mutase
MISSQKAVLRPHDRLAEPPGPVVLVILDGVGVGPDDAYNAVTLASTPTLDQLKEEGLHRTLVAHGTRVGLPSDADMGNSEVGHNILGAGRIFDQGAKCVEKAIASGGIWQGAWAGIEAQAKAKDASVHLIGLLSDGNVHSNISHIFAMLDRARAQGLAKVYLHVLTDGRDVPDNSAHVYVERLETHLAAIREATGFDYQIASGGGRMITTMDRYEADWRIVERGWQAHVHGQARAFPSALQAIATQRLETPGISDQRLEPFVVATGNGEPVATIKDDDCVVFFNFRGDRALQISQAFTAGDNFSGFERGKVPDVLFVGMMLYDGDLNVPEKYLVSPETVSNTVSEYFANTGITQFACAETQKYGHVTYFWNGNRSDKFDKDTETYLEIPSDRVPFDERPWMKSAETADEIIKAVQSGRYRFIRVNFAGGDMVGHTGSLPAAKIAIESLDIALARIIPVIEAAKGCLVVTADHGNADEMVERDKAGEPIINADGKPKGRTSHTLNPVPITIRDYSDREFVLRDGLHNAGLANVAATLVELLGYGAPDEYEASLVDAG